MNILKIRNDIEKAILFGLIFAIFISFARFDTYCDDLRQNVLRLHILANSDSDFDQNIKLEIRNEILEKSGCLFGDAENLEIAEDIAKKNLKEFEKTANEVLENNNIPYKAKAKLGKSYFETREYETFTLPAGYYNSLIITLGKGEGHNWWCVIYPAVCIPSSSEHLSKSTTKKSSAIAENSQKYKVRFKAVEIYEDLKRKYKNYSSSKAPV